VESTVEFSESNVSVDAALIAKDLAPRRTAQIERLDLSHQYSSFDRYPTAANTEHRRSFMTGYAEEL